MFLSKAFLILGALLRGRVAHGNQLIDCSVRYSIGALITKRDLKLKGHQKKLLPFSSFTQCSLRCIQKNWCISINFEMGESQLPCELNDYGIERESFASAGNGEFEVKKGFVFSQFRPSQFGCHNNPCSNGGTCIVDCKEWQKTRCICPKGFYGSRCNIDIDECSSNPCRNNGTCTDTINGYTCACTPGFHGDNCQYDACDDLPCKNGANCSLFRNSFICTCAAGFKGKTCNVVDSAECTTYTNITDLTRNVNYGKVNRKCDSSLFVGWYRLTGGAGRAMPSTCVPSYRCNTDAPGWLRDPHPTIQEGIMTRRVCFSWQENCCGWFTDIKVRNCSAYYVYEFKQLTKCYLRYCGKD